MKKLRHSLDRSSRSDFVQAEIKKQNLEREEMGYAPRKAKRVEPAVQKEMCHVVISTNKEMCHVVEIPFGQRLNSTVPEQRDVSYSVPKATRHQHR